MDNTNEKQVNPLTEEEKILKNWDYATIKNRAFSSAHNLTVTNKRVIHTCCKTHKNGSSISKQEIKNECITGVNVSSANQNFRMFAILLFALAAVMLLCAFTLSPILFVGFAVFVIGGIIYLFKGKASLSLTIYTKFENHNAMRLSVNTGVSLLKGRKKLKIRVSKDVAEDIVNNIGSYLLVD